MRVLKKTRAMDSTPDWPTAAAVPSGLEAQSPEWLDDRKELRSVVATFGPHEIVGKTGEVYQMQNVLGSGTFGRVSRGVRVSDGLPVAIKFSSKRKDALHEAEMMTYITSRGAEGVVKLLDGPIEGPSNGIYTVMDLVQSEGEDSPASTLREYIELLAENQSTLEARRDDMMVLSEDILAFMQQLARIMLGLHRICVVHNDLKPNNIMVREQTVQLLLIDFGLSCFAPGCRPRDSAHSMGLEFLCKPNRVGNSAYVPPEIRTGWVSPTQYDYDYTKIDCYAVGMVFMDMVTGEFSWNRSKAYLAAMNTASRDRRIAEIYSGTRELDELIADLIDDNPARRISLAEASDRLASVRLRDPLPILTGRGAINGGTFTGPTPNPYPLEDISEEV